MYDNCYNKKVMISIENLVLEDIDRHAKLNGLCRSAFICYLFSFYLYYRVDEHRIDYSKDIEIKALKDEISRLKALK